MKCETLSFQNNVGFHILLDKFNYPKVGLSTFTNWSSNNIKYLHFFLLFLSEACWWGGGITKEDCEEFEKNEECEDLYQGRIQTMEMAVELYKVVPKVHLNYVST